MRIRSRVNALATICAIALGLGSAAGCQSKAKKETAEPTPSGGDEAVASTTEAPLMRELLEVVKSCKINPEHGVISQCTDHEKRDLVRDFRSGNRDRLAALSVLVDALARDDAKLQTVAARLLEGAYRRSLGDVKAGAVDKALAERFINLVPKLNQRQRTQVLPAAVHAAMVAGADAALYKMLDALPDKNQRALGYANLLVHGGANAVDKVVALASDTDPAVVAAALQSARNWEGSDPTLKPKLCDLGQSKLSSDDAGVSMRAAQIMVHCGGTYVDKLLDELQKRDQDKTMTPGLVRSLYLLCQKKQGVQPGSAEQCARTRSLLEGWVKNQELGTELRASSLFEIGVQFADEKSEKLCSQYENDADSRVKAAAGEAVRRIRRKLGKHLVEIDAKNPGTRRVPRPRGTRAVRAPKAPATGQQP